MELFTQFVLSCRFEYVGLGLAELRSGSFCRSYLQDILCWHRPSRCRRKPSFGHSTHGPVSVGILGFAEVRHQRRTGFRVQTPVPICGLPPRLSPQLWPREKRKSPSPWRSWGSRSSPRNSGQHPSVSPFLWCGCPPKSQPAKRGAAILLAYVYVYTGK